MTRKQRRLTLIGLCGVVLAAAAALVLTALKDEIVFFRSPTDLATLHVAPGDRIRLGGLVLAGSVVKSGGEKVDFVVTDTAHQIPVTYVGLLPDLFREGQGVVAEGTIAPDGRFHADTVLAKHDERYMPKEVVDALKARGVWEEGQTKTSSAAP
ncbi:cytochrome c maturation protein CcmE [Segnochrobactrum spirostomi]|uniref:Cytochrome c-type biogenesis protein CcmE n=1 Tax=Segnochrobactrum spirostomi TaxID=2608987 RepID=A0A6A7Y066_9HYPH|nr:cytochrome c maturation protein CcmE [Segnochrobactrum spirostomi]MQT12304.1 cytochrome c maturation protein CcmE [Segnochrobactrum spirostomi]